MKMTFLGLLRLCLCLFLLITLSCKAFKESENLDRAKPQCWTIKVIILPGINLADAIFSENQVPPNLASTFGNGLTLSGHRSISLAYQTASYATAQLIRQQLMESGLVEHVEIIPKWL